MSVNRERKNRLHLRFTDEERDFFEKFFEKSGFDNRNDFILYLLLNSKIVNLHYDMSIFKDIQIDLSQIGNNLNQIARMANYNEYIPKIDVDTVKAMRKDIDAVWKDFQYIKDRLPKRKLIQTNKYKRDW